MVQTISIAEVRVPSRVKFAENILGLGVKNWPNKREGNPPTRMLGWDLATFQAGHFDGLGSLRKYETKTHGTN